MVILITFQNPMHNIFRFYSMRVERISKYIFCAVHGITPHQDNSPGICPAKGFFWLVVVLGIAFLVGIFIRLGIVPGEKLSKKHFARMTSNL